MDKMIHKVIILTTTMMLLIMGSIGISVGVFATYLMVVDPVINVTSDEIKTACMETSYYGFLSSKETCINNPTKFYNQLMFEFKLLVPAVISLAMLSILLPHYLYTKNNNIKFISLFTFKYDTNKI